MFKLKQKTKTASLSLALAAAMTGGVMMGTSTSVQAANIANDGIGEVLIFPYYTARGGWQSYFNITNTSERTILVKVRWHEGVNSRDARDFNIALSPYDVWTAAVIPDPDGEGARVVTSDNSCTAPALTHEDTDRPNLKGVDFTNHAFKGKYEDGGSELIGRTKEGYFSVYVMAVAKKENNDIIDPPTRDLPDGEIITIAEAVEHTDAGLNNEGIPKDCSVFVKENIKFEKGQKSLLGSNDTTSWLVFNEAKPGQEGEFHEPNNVLRGRAVLINPADGIAMGYDPTVIANFYNPTERGKFAGMDSDANDTMMASASTAFPNMDSAKPPAVSWVDDTPGFFPQGASSAVAGFGVVRNVSASEATATYGIGDGRSVDAISLLFNRAAIVNDYNIAGESETDWVLTLPTKRFYVDTDAHKFAGIQTEGPSIEPFADSVNGEPFNDNNHITNIEANDGESCFDVSMRVWDREEGELTTPGGLDFSPAPDGPGANQFCYETNIISFGEAVDSFVDDVTGETRPISNVMKSQLAKSFDKLAGDYGWAQLEFGAAGGESLPVIGLRLETRKQAGNPAASYGFANAHSYKRNVKAYMVTPENGWEMQTDRTNPNL